MSQVLVRDVDPAVVARIKERASRRGTSMQRELQRILEQGAELPEDDGTVYPPVRPVAVRGKPASRLLVEERR